MDKQGKQIGYPRSDTQVASALANVAANRDLTGKGKMMQPIPWTVAEIQGWFMEWMMPVPTVTLDQVPKLISVFPLTRLCVTLRGQVKMLQSDNVVAEGAATFSDLGIQAKSVGEIVPSYLK